MMNSLFSSFDPSNSYLSLNMSVLILGFIYPILNKMFSLPGRKTWLHLFMVMNINKEITAIINNNFLKGKTNLLMTMFTFILLFNILSLFPYIFTMTAHMSFSLTMALPFWLSFIMFSMMKSTNTFMAHLVPLSTPMALSQFMVIIESVSQVIRPITLSVRLAANMTAGHILMALVSAPIFMFNPMTLALMTLVILEVAVAFIQSYVFVILLTMYLSETNH